MARLYRSCLCNFGLVYWLGPRQNRLVSVVVLRQLNDIEEIDKWPEERPMTGARKRGRSSVGRATGLQPVGRRFDSDRLH